MTAIITDNALVILKKRYLSNGESVNDLFRRVSGGNMDYENLMRGLMFLPNSPTLFNMGLNNGCTSSACFVFDFDDSMLDGPRSIVATRAKAIAVAKAGGGVGYYGGNLRPRGSGIKSVHRVACGPGGVLLDCHAISKLITQGGKRELAQMWVQPVWHQDIVEIINIKNSDPQGLGSFNISVSWPDEWVKGTLYDPASKAKALWDMQVESAWKTGCPGMLFPDRINQFNPNKHLGLINATNPCGETPNRSDEPCNLGSQALCRYYFHGNRSINWADLERDAYLTTCFLDDILDRNVFPHPDIDRAARLTRKLGLGVMGWADLLALMHIHYDTEEAVELGEELMRRIQDAALAASRDMGKEKGPYEGYSDETEHELRRNETVTSIAPTGTISILAGCSSGIEPHYDLEWERTTAEGIKLKERIPVWDQLEGFVPKTALEVAPEWHVRHQAAFQKHTCLGVSKTVNLPNSATENDVSEIYRLMYKLGCKGGTVYRDGCRREQVLVSEKTKSVFLMSQGSQKRKLPNDRKAIVHKFRVGSTTAFLTVGLYDNGDPGEIFITGKFGTSIAGLLDAFAISTSVALQGGVPLKDLINHHKHTRFEPCGLTNNKDIPACTSIPDYVVRFLELVFLNKKGVEVSSPGESGVFCPECGREAIYQGGCLSCPDKSCGWTRCN